ncbi:LysR family transcriptional regulator [Humidisolicoccus flavus]|uniref:LysR family transcriptional regulator n=1 Tax=Humidisolicoccus flavus TaxID=3111414 RepID=UPI00324EE1F4
MIDPVSLRALIALHDEGTVAAAAESLGYTGSNVTQHLRKLERHYAVPMVERAGRRVVLTPAAIALVQRARPIVDDLEQLVRAPLGEREPQGTLRVGAFPTAIRGLMVPVLARAASQYPRLKIVPIEVEQAEALEMLAQGSLDAVVHKSWGRIPPDEFRQRVLTRVELGNDALDAVVPAFHPLAENESIALRELATDQWALSPIHDPYSRWIASHDPALLAPLAQAFEAAEFQTLIRYVEAGIAVTVVPRLGRGILPSTVRAVPLRDEDAFRIVHLYARPIAAASTTMRALAELLRKALRSEEQVEGLPPISVL